MSNVSDMGRLVIQLQSAEGSCGSGEQCSYNVSSRRVFSDFDVCLQVSPDCDREQLVQQVFDLALCLAHNWDDLMARVRLQRQDMGEIMATSSWVGPQTGVVPDRLAQLEWVDDHAVVLMPVKFHA